MNNGANIVYLGASDLVRTFGDSKLTNGYNRTEMSRRYVIRKDRKAVAAQLLKRGFKAPDYANLYIAFPPRVSEDATHAMFDCTFSGILDHKEGGNGPLYERVERPENIASISSSITFIQPVYRFFYTIPASSESRVSSREIARPEKIVARDQSTGDKLFYEGDNFFWECYDLQRQNFDKYDEVLESWRLTYIA
jgi:hypothetical protein